MSANYTSVIALKQLMKSFPIFFLYLQFGFKSHSLGLSRKKWKNMQVYDYFHGKIKPYNFVKAM